MGWLGYIQHIHACYVVVVVGDKWYKCAVCVLVDEAATCMLYFPKTCVEWLLNHSASVAGAKIYICNHKNRQDVELYYILSSRVLLHARLLTVKRKHGPCQGNYGVCIV